MGALAARGVAWGLFAAVIATTCSALASHGLGLRPGMPAARQSGLLAAGRRPLLLSGPLRLRGGGEASPYLDENGNPKDWDEISSLEKWDSRLTKVFGKYWKFIKNTAGLAIDPTDLPDNSKHVAASIADFKKLSQAEREKVRDFAGGTIRPIQLKDKWLYWFMSQGPVYWMNPLTYFLRYMRGTDKFVKSAVVYLQDPPDWAKDFEISQHLEVLAARYPDGFSLTKAQMSEALYRAEMYDYAETLTKAQNGTWVVKGKRIKKKKDANFADKEDTKLKRELEEMLAEKPGRNNTVKPLFAVATKKYKGAHKDAVHRLQRELMRIQVDNTYEVELINDDIMHWWVTIEGANGTFYEGEKFKVRFRFDEKYPQEPPEVTFVTHVPGWRLPETQGISTGRCPSWRAGQQWQDSYSPNMPTGHHVPIHPHIYTNGNICLSTIYSDWKMTLGVEAVCLSLVSMLSSAKEKRPPEDNQMHVDSAPKSAKDMTGWDFHDNEA